jgi:hypothetical protein
MTLFPRIDPKYYVEGDFHLQKYLNEAYAEMISINISYWSEADIDSRFRSGDQTLWNDIYGNLPAYRRRDFNFNIIQTPCNMISGYQRQHRKQVVCTPIEGSDEAAAAQYSKLLIWANNYANVPQTFSQACDGAVTTGMNLLQVWMDYRSDPINGDIRVENLSYNNFLIDPYFRKQDLSDCNHIWIRKYLSKEEAASLMPDRKEEIMSMEGAYNKDGKFQFLPESYNYAIRKLLIYDEFYYRDYRTRKMLVDTYSGETMEWRGSDERIQEFVRDFPHVKVLEQQVQSTKLAILLNGQTMYHGPNPMGIDRFPFVVVPFYYDPQIPYYPQRIRGLVRDMRDTQYLFNRRMIINLDIAESTIASGWKYKESALINPNDVFLTGQGKGLALKDDAQMTDVEKIEPSAPRPELMALGEQLKALIPQITGINEELLGSATDDKAGILSMLRQGAGLVTLQKIFDQWDLSLKQLGEIQLDLIQANWTPGKVKRIINEEPAPEFYTANFGKYDCVVEEAVMTPTQRQLAFQQTLYLRELGMQIPDDYVLKLSTLQDKDKLIQTMAAQAQQAQQMQQMQAQAMMQESQAKAEDLHARAVANQGLGYERASRIAENQALAVERRAAAIKDIQTGNLDQVRAAKELQGMDLTQLQQLVDILKALQEDSAEQAGVKEKPAQSA